MKLAIAASVLATAASFTPTAFKAQRTTALNWGNNAVGMNSAPAPAAPPAAYTPPAPAAPAAGHTEIGAGGMADTRNPDAMVHEDPRKSISAAPSFEEYLRSRGDGFAPGAPAPAPAAFTPPAPVAPAPVAYTPPAPVAPAAGHSEIGAGGMADTRNPDAMVHEDPRKSISAAPSFEEYLRSRGDGFAPGAPAPAAAAPAPVAYTPPAPVAAPVAATSNVAPDSSGPFTYGKYDDQIWDNEAKKDVYNAWDPNAPRTTWNFNPFETHKGNSPDASGIYPGEPFYKDPIRGDVSFAQMQAERAEADERAANPKAGDVKGAPGRKN